MIANYHTHTYRCHHATGTEREYIENAIAGGLKILGFSDHTPQFYDGGFVDRDKMLPSELEGYVNTILALKNEYKNEIEIHLGLEVEYYPAYFGRLIEFAGQFPIEYFILGQHHLGNEIGDVTSGIETHDVSVLQRYTAQCAEALATGRFTYLAHPDLINFVGDEAIYEKEMRKLCLCAKRLGVPLEINFLGIWTHRNYPNPLFWKIAGEVGNEVVYGSDAHRPDKVWNPEALAEAEKITAANRLHVLGTVELVNPFQDK